MPREYQVISTDDHIIEPPGLFDGRLPKEFADRTPSGPARQASRDAATLKPEDGIAVFERLLRLGDLDRVVVSRGPLTPRLARPFRSDDQSRPTWRSAVARSQ